MTKDDVDAICADMPSTRVVTVQPITLDDVLGDVNTIANAMGVPARGERLVRHLRSRLAAVSEAVEGLHAIRPKVVHLEWLDPLMGSGYWSVAMMFDHDPPPCTPHPPNPPTNIYRTSPPRHPATPPPRHPATPPPHNYLKFLSIAPPLPRIAECVEAAGCDMILGQKGGNSATVDGLERLQTADMIILAPCGFSIERSYAEVGRKGRREGEREGEREGGREVGKVW